MLFDMHHFIGTSFQTAACTIIPSSLLIILTWKERELTSHAIAQSVFQLWKDVDKTACKKNVYVAFHLPSFGKSFVSTAPYLEKSISQNIQL